MIFVTQGHQRGIGLEVFLKSFSSLQIINDQDYKLIVSLKTLINTLNTLKIDHKLSQNTLRIRDRVLNLKLIEASEFSETLTAILYALKEAKPGDILNTLPSSKSEFLYNGVQYKGHTDFLADYYKNELGMCFLSYETNFMLLTDHIPLDQVYKKLTQVDLFKKVQQTVESFPKDRKIKEIFIAGINPHAGEEGVISDQDKIIKKLAQQILQQLNIPTSVHSGDTMHFHIKNKSQLFIYPSHDQGLGVFKTKYGLEGINFSAGVPIQRVSVDHGTAFELYGQDKAQTKGMDFLLTEIKNWT